MALARRVLVRWLHGVLVLYVAEHGTWLDAAGGREVPEEELGCGGYGKVLEWFWRRLDSHVLCALCV